MCSHVCIFFHIMLSLHSAKIFQKFRICWDLFDGIQKGDVDFYLFEQLKELTGF